MSFFPTVTPSFNLSSDNLLLDALLSQHVTKEAELPLVDSLYQMNWSVCSFEYPLITNFFVHGILSILRRNHISVASGSFLLDSPIVGFYFHFVID